MPIRGATVLVGGALVHRTRATYRVEGQYGDALDRLQEPRPAPISAHDLIAFSCTERQRSLLRGPYVHRVKHPPSGGCCWSSLIYVVHVELVSLIVVTRAMVHGRWIERVSRVHVIVV